MSPSRSGADVSRHDLVIAGGTLIDPAQGVHGRRDVAVRDGVVAEVSERITAGDGATVLDASGKVLTPGLIDVHGHFFHGYTTVPAVADEVCSPAAVTTAADAGTAGFATYPTFRDYVIPCQQTRLVAWLSIAASGYLMSRVLGTEFHDMRVLDADAAVDMITANRTSIVGVKLRLGVDLQTAPEAREALAKATDVARRAEVPLMVHVFRVPIPFAELLDRLAPGDVVTHAFHASPGGILDDSGHVLPAVHAAIERGILLDVGYAGGLLCDLDVARSALGQGVTPATLGTDMGHPDVVPVPSFYGVSELVGAFAALGMGLDDALAAVTVRAAAMLGLSAEIGSLRPGMAGDLAVFTLRRGRFRWLGAGGQFVDGDQRLEPEATIRGGAVVWRRGDPVSTPAAETLAVA
jgi:dihydroorotase